MTAEALNQKIANVERGSYWFGIIGRMLIFLGGLAMMLALFMIYPYMQDGFKEMANLPVSLLITAVQNLFVGWLFLLARDAFDAIVGLFNDTRDIV